MRTKLAPVVPHLVPALLVCALLATAYYLVPVEPGATGARVAVRGTLAVVAAAAVALLVVQLVGRLLRSESGAGAAGLVVALFGGVVLFAFVDFLVATQPGQFHGLVTKTDGLYFAVTTLATVGYGDIHATGQLARVVVTVQQLYNLTVLATGAAALLNRLTTRARPAR